MSKTSEKFQAIADSIRSVNGQSEERYTPDQMPEAIKALAAGYTLTKDGSILKLTDPKGNVQTVDIGADQNTTYTLSLDGNKLSLTDSGGTVQTVDIPENTDTKYSMSLDGNILTVTPSPGGDPQKIDLSSINADRIGGLRFSLTEKGLLHIEEVE